MKVKRKLFQPPERHPGWDDTLTAGTTAPSCPQTNNSVVGREQVLQSEDCLYLNVWTPAVSPASLRGESHSHFISFIHFRFQHTANGRQLFSWRARNSQPVEGIAFLVKSLQPKEASSSSHSIIVSTFSVGVKSFYYFKVLIHSKN